MMNPSRPLVSAVVGGFVMLLMAATSPAATGSLQEIERAQRLNQAWLRVLDTRSAYATERLRRLETLKARGHASWLEMARQAAAVEALIEHRRAAVKFEQWLSDLRNQRWPDVDFARAARQADSTRDESTVEVSNYRKSSTPSPVPSHFSTNENLDRQRLQLAKAAMESAQREFEVLQKRQANDGTVAAPSHEFTTRFPPAPPDQGTFDHDPIDHKALDEGGLSRGEIMWLAAYPQVARATLAAAKAESQSTAFVKIARILARKSQLRWEAVTALHEMGHATSVELEMARSKVADAEAAFAQAQEIARRRQQRWSSLQRQLMVHDAASRESPRKLTGAVTAIASDPSALRIFIAQHLAQFQAVAVRSESQMEARLLAELLRRLERTGLDHQAAHREREMTRLDLDLALARCDAAGERHVALRHQTDQFVAAVKAQNQSSMLDSLATIAARLVAPRFAISYLRWPQTRLFLSSGMPRRAAPSAWYVPRCFHWSKVECWPRRRASVLPGAYTRCSASPSLYWTRRCYGLGPYLDGLYYSRLLWRVGVRPSIRPWRYPLYNDFYTFGSPRHVNWSSSLRWHCLTTHTPQSLAW